MCLLCRQRSFNKRSDVMGSSFFTALGFLFMWTAELLCAAETFLPGPHKAHTHTRKPAFQAHFHLLTYNLCSSICDIFSLYIWELKRFRGFKRLFMLAFWLIAHIYSGFWYIALCDIRFSMLELEFTACITKRSTFVLLITVGCVVIKLFAKTLILWFLILCRD